MKLNLEHIYKTLMTLLVFCVFIHSEIRINELEKEAFLRDKKHIEIMQDLVDTMKNHQKGIEGNGKNLLEFIRVYKVREGLY